MAYIGRQPTVGNFQICDAISVVNGQAAYTMQVASVNVIPETANHMIVSLNGVIQKPGSSYTVSGSTITFSQNLVTGDVIDFIQILGSVLDIGTPSDGTVTESKIGSNAVTSAKMFSGFANGITMADQWRLTTTFTGNASPIATNLERNDSVGYGKIGTGMTESSGVFTFPSTGIYFITFSACIYRVNADAVMNSEIAVTTDNSSYTVVARGYTGTGSLASNYNPTYTSIFLDVTDVSNVKVRFNISSNNQNNGVVGSSGTNTTHMTFLRMGDT